jgi:two-component system sensor histidine kinase QseC
VTSIRARLLLTLLCGLAAVLVAGGAAVYWIADSGLTAQFDEGLESRAHALASLVKLEPAGLVFEVSDAPPTLMTETAFELRDQSGMLLRQSQNLASASLPVHDLSEGQLVYGEVLLPNSISGRAAWLAFRPRVDPDDWQGLDMSKARPPLLIVAAAMDRNPIDRALSTLLGALLGVGVVAALTALGLVAAGVRWGLAPLDRLRNQLGAIGDRTITNRLDAAGVPRELLTVYSEINGMLNRIEAALQRERSFASAAAHELRTPLAELRTVVEVARRWPDPVRSDHALLEALTIGLEMERLVESLLLISRGKLTSTDDAPTSITTIVHDCIQRANGSIADRQLQFDVDLERCAEASRRVCVPREAMEIIIRNLLDNAIHYTPSRGHVTIRDGAGPIDSTLFSILVVENGPVDLTPEELPRLFEPFWRLEKSRTDRQHVGLGLTVVKRIAEAIGWDIQARLVERNLQMSLLATTECAGQARRQVARPGSGAE